MIYIQFWTRKRAVKNTFPFVVDSLLCSKRFFSGYSGFPLSSKTNIIKFQFYQESDENDFVDVLPPNHLFFSDFSRTFREIFQDYSRTFQDCVNPAY